MFVLGLINVILFLMAFCSAVTRQVGAGIYLYALSMISIFTISLLNIKFWFLILTHICTSVPHSMLRAGCIIIEPSLRLSLSIDNWFNACVAMERTMAVFRGVNFNKRLSQRAARWMIFVLPLFICGSFAHEFVYRDLFYDDDDDGNRDWCVLEYSLRIVSYSTFILSFHALAPFSINILSALYLIIDSVPS